MLRSLGGLGMHWSVWRYTSQKRHDGSANSEGQTVTVLLGAAPGLSVGDGWELLPSTPMVHTQVQA